MEGRVVELYSVVLVVFEGVDMEGVVTHNLSNGKFRLKLENGVEVIAHLSGKIRLNRIKIVVGDKVTLELSPYDLTKGRITYRYR